MILLLLAYRSLKNRLVATLITIFSVALSVFLILGVERIRHGAEDGFSNTLSQTDLVVGARGSDLQLLLYTVFHMGDATNNISYKSYQFFTHNPSVAWTIPISLGDSHKGFRVVATDHNFYEHYRFQGNRSVEMAEGKPADDVFDVVVGAEVVKKLHYSLGSSVVISHGISTVSLVKHGDKPFHVVGILKPTGTPVDRAVYITLEGMEAIHIDWKDGAPPVEGHETPPDQIKKSNIKIGQITSFLLRTKNRIETLRLQRDINTYEDEPLMSAIPGVTLAKLWATLGYAEKALKAISACVALVSILSLLLVLYTSLNERRREMAILRALGLRPYKLFFLLMIESVTLVLAGSLFGAAFLYAFLWFAQPWLVDRFGLFLPLQSFTLEELIYLGVLFATSFVVGFIPALSAYRKSLADGLSVRV